MILLKPVKLLCMLHQSLRFVAVFIIVSNFHAQVARKYYEWDQLPENFLGLRPLAPNPQHRLGSPMWPPSYFCNSKAVAGFRLDPKEYSLTELLTSFKVLNIFWKDLHKQNKETKFDLKLNAITEGKTIPERHKLRSRWGPWKCLPECIIVGIM